VSPRIKDDSVEAVSAAADIVDVVSGYTSLRKRGATYSGLCPFHQEKTPSFSVSADKGLYYCFGCGEGGNVFTFVQRLENLSFAEAVEQLGERFSVPVEYEEGKTGLDRDRSGERRLLALLDKTAEFYTRYLWDSTAGETARVYLGARGLERAVCEQFRVGLAPGGWRGLHGRALKEGYTEAEMEAAGLLIRQPDKAYDRFRGRLMFPLVDHRGRVVGFGGRTLGDENPKYLNSPEGPVYRKGHLLYGLFQARRAIADHDEVLIVEGYTDVLALAQAGVGNVVASMGTALTDGQLGLLSRFTPNVHFMFDADRAGIEAAQRSGELARNRSLRAMVVPLPSGEDPADVAMKGGAEAVRKLTAGRISILRFELLRALESSDTASAAGRVQAFDVVRAILAKASSPKEREEEVRLIADRLRLSPENVEILLREPGVAPIAPRGPGASPSPARGSEARAVPSYRDRVRSPEATVEREFLVAVVSNPAEARGLLGKLDAEHFVDPLHREAFLGLRDVILSPTPARALHDLARDDSEVGRFFVRLAVESEVGGYGRAMLHERHLQLEGQHLARAVQLLSARLESGERDVDVERRLFRLGQLQQEVRAMLANVEEG